MIKADLKVETIYYMTIFNSSKFVGWFITILLITSCSQQEEEFIGWSDQALNIKASSVTVLGVSSIPLHNKDSLGLFVKPTGISGFLQLLETNRKYTYNSNLSIFELHGNPIYYPQSGSIDLIAYGPYKTGVTTNYTIDVSNQANQKAIDLLYSNSTNGINKGNGIASLSFDHQLSKVVFHLQKGNGNTVDLESINIEIQGFHNRADFNLVTGLLGSKQVSQAPISIGTAREGTIIPNDNLTNRSFKFNNGASEWIYNLPSIDKFEKGKQYNYIIYLNDKHITVELSSISPWNLNSETALEGIISNSPIEYAYIPAGTFLMGAPDTARIHNNEAQSNYRQHWVRIGKSFFMSKNEITIGQYAEFLNAIGVQKTAVSEIRHEINGKSIHLFSLSPTRTLYFENDQWLVESGLENYPMSLVTWAGALAYAQWKGATLPTEAQWEYAYRAGTKTKFFTGNFAGEMMSYGNFYNNENGDVQPVGQKRPNPWGLNDIAGNLLEWCLDGPSGNVLAPYPTANNELMPLIDPIEPIHTSTFAYYRGGSSAGSVQNATAYHRYTQSKSTSAPQIGFRIVINP